MKCQRKRKPPHLSNQETEEKNDCQCILQQKSVQPKTEGEKVANVFIFLGFLRVPYKTV